MRDLVAATELELWRLPVTRPTNRDDRLRGAPVVVVRTIAAGIRGPSGGGLIRVQGKYRLHMKQSAPLMIVAKLRISYYVMFGQISASAILCGRLRYLGYSENCAEAWSII